MGNTDKIGFKYFLVMKKLICFVNSLETEYHSSEWEGLQDINVNQTKISEITD